MSKHYRCLCLCYSNRGENLHMCRMGLKADNNTWILKRTVPWSLSKVPLPLCCCPVSWELLWKVYLPPHHGIQETQDLATDSISPENKLIRISDKESTPDLWFTALPFSHVGAIKAGTKTGTHQKLTRPHHWQNAGPTIPSGSSLTFWSWSWWVLSSSS